MGSFPDGRLSSRPKGLSCGMFEEAEEIAVRARRTSMCFGRLQPLRLDEPSPTSAQADRSRTSLVRLSAVDCYSTPITLSSHSRPRGMQHY